MLPIFAHNKQTFSIRPLTEVDAQAILHGLGRAWQISLRVSPLEFKTNLNAISGFVAETKAGLSGFMVIEPRPPELAVLVAAGLRSNWRVKPYLDLLLPEIEHAARQRNLTRLIYVGPASWLIDELGQRKFQVREWIVVLQRPGLKPPDKPPVRAHLRPFHPNDITALTRLDALAFDHVWHKSPSKFAQALATSDSLTIAELDGQLVGYAWCEIHPHHAHLNRLAVHPDYQGRGIGAQLLHWAITNVLTQGVHRITLNTQEHNHRSLALYQRFGFEITNQRMPVLVKSLT